MVVEQLRVDDEVAPEITPRREREHDRDRRVDQQSQADERGSGTASFCKPLERSPGPGEPAGEGRHGGQRIRAR